MIRNQFFISGDVLASIYIGAWFLLSCTKILSYLVLHSGLDGFPAAAAVSFTQLSLLQFTSRSYWKSRSCFCHLLLPYWHPTWNSSLKGKQEIIEICLPDQKYEETRLSRGVHKPQNRRKVLSGRTSESAFVFLLKRTGMSKIFPLQPAYTVLTKNYEHTSLSLLPRCFCWPSSPDEREKSVSVFCVTKNSWTLLAIVPSSTVCESMFSMSECTHNHTLDGLCGIFVILPCFFPACNSDRSATAHAKSRKTIFT